MDSIKMLKPGDICPCCGQPIKTTDPAALLLLTSIRDYLEELREDGKL